MKTNILRMFTATLGLTSLLLTQGAGATNTQIFTNTCPITIPSVGIGNPYPCSLVVSGVIGSILDLNVTLVGFSHTSPSDVGVLLVGPNGRSVVLMDGAGDFTPVSNVTLTFDDEATSLIPFFATLTSGTFRPANYFGDVFDPPAPQTGYGTLLSAFDNISPNGTWRVFVEDFAPGDSGSLSGGFRLIAQVPEPSTLLLLGLGVAVLGFRTRAKTKGSKGDLNPAITSNAVAAGCFV